MIWFGRSIALALMALVVGVLLTGAKKEVPLPDETPLADLLEVIVTGREIVAFDARGAGETTIALRLEEKVLWTGTRGKVGVALTNERVLAVGTQSTSWQQAAYQQTEVPPKDALLGGRVALVVTSKRALGFSSGSGSLVEYRLGPREVVLASRAGESVAVVVTDRQALGLSPVSGGFFRAGLNLHERIENVTTRANLAIVTTNRRILVFRGPTGRWEERSLDLR